MENALFEYWIMVASVYTIMMQVGFMLISTGFVKKRNQMNIISLYFLGMVSTILIFYFWGYSLSNGADGGILGQHDLDF